MRAEYADYLLRPRGNPQVTVHKKLQQCSLFRCFLRFLHWSGCIPVDLSEAVIAPMQPRLERPRRALAWQNVQRLLKAVDPVDTNGPARYALL